MSCTGLPIYLPAILGSFFVDDFFGEVVSVFIQTEVFVIDILQKLDLFFWGDLDRTGYP